MKTEKNILIAFLLNISFSIIELIGGIYTNSISIISDSIHDFGDAISIGISYFLEKISKKKPDENYTYGYLRYSVLGAFITTVVLTTGSVLVIISSTKRLFNPETINYNGMIIFAIFGVVINFFAAYFTREGDSLNQKAVNLHMLEDVLGWVVVLIGSILMKFFDISIIDSLMSIGISIFILFNAMKNLKGILDLFLEKTPSNISVNELKNHLEDIAGVVDIHHIHIWNIDEAHSYATLHLVVEKENEQSVKQKIREELKEHGISHVTIETENSVNDCTERECKPQIIIASHHHHHH